MVARRALTSPAPLFPSPACGGGSAWGCFVKDATIFRTPTPSLPRKREREALERVRSAA
jgi:hypothetical protein